MQQRIAEGGHCDADRFGGRCEAPGVGTEAERGSPGTKPPSLAYICSAPARVKAAVCRAYWGSHRQGRFESSAVEALWEKAGKLRISAAHTLCNA